MSAPTGNTSLSSCVNSPMLPETAAFIASASHAGIPPTANYNGPDQTGAAATQCSADVPRGRRLDAFTTCVEPLLAYTEQHRSSSNHPTPTPATTPAPAPPKVTVCSSAMVLRVCFSPPHTPPPPVSASASATAAAAATLGSPPATLHEPVTTGVELQLASGETVFVPAQKEVVLAAGALHTPQLLMLSGVGDPATLSHHKIPVVSRSHAVGKGLQDHGVCPVHLRLKTAGKVLLGNAGIPGIAFFQSGLDKERAKTDVSGVPRGPDVQLVMCARGSADGAPKQAVQSAEREYPTIKHDCADGSNERAALRMQQAVAAGRLQRDAGAVGNGLTDAASIDTVLNRPQSRGTVTLADKSPSSLPVVNGNWLSHPDDVARQLCGLHKIRDILQAGPFADAVAEVVAPAKFLTSATDDELRTYIRTQQQSTWHYSCTAQMGPRDDPRSVCDPAGKVHGVRGLRVADCSLMPFVVAGNTNATALMIGDKIGASCASEHGFRCAPSSSGSSGGSRSTGAATVGGGKGGGGHLLPQLAAHL